MTNRIDSSTPVIIPAYKAQDDIERTLRSLDADIFEPLVVINGPADNTAEIAERYGVTVIDIEQQGKLPAIQQALRYMGDKALSPLLLLDADSRPIFPSMWRRGMITQVTNEQPNTPGVVGGPVVFTEDTVFENSIRTARRITRALRTRNDVSEGSRGAQYGPNMAIHIATSELLEEILALDNYWPGEDRALADAVVRFGGTYTQPISPDLLVLSPTSKSYLSFAERKRIGLEKAREQVNLYYQENAPPNSIRYNP